MNPAKDLRTIAELTQQQAADLVSVSLRTWKAWEASQTMPAKKAQSFRDALMVADGTAPHDATIDTAVGVLKTLARKELPPMYSQDDPFGQLRIEHLRFQAPVVEEPDSETESQPDVLASDDVQPDEIAKLIADLGLAKA